MTRRITCSGTNHDGTPCGNPVRRQGQRCHKHPRGTASRKLAAARSTSWNATSHKAAPASHTGRRLEQGLLARILGGDLTWIPRRMRGLFARKGPLEAAASWIPYRRSNRGAGSTRPATPHSSIYRRQLRREQ